MIIFITLKIKYFKGANTFIMSVDEKLENSTRKKEIGVKLISEKEFKRALKTFQNVNSFFDLGKFTEDDLNRIKPVLHFINK